MKLIGLVFLALGWCRGGAAVKDISLLPWSELIESIDDPNQLIDTGLQQYIDECVPEFEKDSKLRFTYNLINQPSGLCLPALFCGYQQCSPEPKYSTGEFTIMENINYQFFNFQLTNVNTPKLLEEVLDPANPVLNLPPKVLFPRNAGDVVAAVNFAKTHGIEISVKNSGHSFSGSSSKANTFLINMNQYKRYAYDNETTNGIIECNDVDVQADVGDIDMDTELCRLVEARGKPAAIRVGGGENFDKLYRSVKEANIRTADNLGRYKYHVVGGAAGSVSPMGWTWQGGLAGSSGGRMHGFGVDQVLQIEAVLPNGEHVRFGPTSWEDSEGYLYPKTTKVSGVCNKNSNDDEDDWIWGACPKETNALFDDLWYAFRGGGGGTWGIVLSVYLQLHDYRPLTYINITDDCLKTPDAAMLAIRFGIDFYVDPDALNITREESSMCGAPNGDIEFYCYSENPFTGYNIISLYRDFVSKNSEGLTEEDAAIAAKCFSATSYRDLAELRTIPEGPNAGLVKSTAPPNYPSETFVAWNILLPKSWILENKDVLANFYVQTINPGIRALFYYAFGGNAEFAHDQTTSLSTAHREAGVMIFSPHIGPPVFPNFLENNWPSLISKMYNFTTGVDQTVIPPHLGSNHLGPITYGPLKDDPTKPCPLNFTRSEANSMCHSAQEAVWGTTALERLESIKQAVDPNGMFNCHHCVGNDKAMPPKDPCTNDPDFKANGKNCELFLQKHKSNKCSTFRKGKLVSDSCPAICKEELCTCKDRVKKIKVPVKGKIKKLSCTQIKNKGFCQKKDKNKNNLFNLCPESCVTQCLNK